MKILHRFTKSLIIEDETKNIYKLIRYCADNNISLRGAYLCQEVKNHIIKFGK